MIGAVHGAFVEAWQELRIHKLRVLLSLVGVAIAVCSLTLVVAMSTVAQDSIRESYERDGGREATVTIDAVDPAYTEDQSALRAAGGPIFEEFSVDWWTVHGEGSTTLATDGGAEYVDVTVSDPSYGTMFSSSLLAGRWFSDGDEQNLSPAVVVNENVLEMAGATTADLPITVELASSEGATPTSATVIGVSPGNDWDYGTVTMLAESPAVDDVLESPPQYSLRAWVPPEIADELAPQIQSRLGATTAGEWSAYRSDFFSEGGDPLVILRTILLAIAGLILFLGVMGLLNIALVTVHQRVREIGIRRSFGATGARVFFSVLMESVVATSLAGIVGIAASVLILRSPVITAVVSDGLDMTPSFPASAAIVGLLVSVGAGAVAGLVPATIATRTRVVEAIRA